MHRFVRRAVVLTATTTLALSPLAGSTPAHAGDAPRDELSAGWLTGQLTDGLIRTGFLDNWTDPANPVWKTYDDYGLSIDAALALAAVGGHDATVGQISDAVAAHVGSYTTGVDWASSDVFAGPTAKALVMAQTAGADPTTYGGVDLVKQLNRRVSTSAPIKGRIQDRTDGADYANVIGQLYAVQGLAAAGSGKAGPALGFLLKQQCEAGYFRLNFTKSKTRADQTCEGGNPETTSAPDTDVTALAVLSLRSLHSAKPSVTSALGDAVRWLKSRQKANGSFGGGTSTEGSNANSTGLAGWALGVSRACTAAVEAAGWIGGLQVSTPTGGPLDGEIGAVAYARSAFTAAEAEGITEAARDQWRRSTAQAAPALGFVTVSECRAG